MDELELEFELDPTLARDCHHLGEYPLSRVLLMNDSQYPWFILVPRRAGVTEIYHLDPADQVQLLKEASALAETLADIFGAKKMNLATLGNQVSQLHLHVVARKSDDPAWPGPVWGKVPPKPYTDDQLEAVKDRIEQLLEGEITFTRPD